MTPTNIMQCVRSCAIAIMLVATATLAAQSDKSSGDRLYNQGVELQKKQTVKAQRQAIEKFRSAKKLYDSAANKKKCDDAIVVSNNIIKGLTDSTPHTTSATTTVKPEATKETLSLSSERLQFDAEERTVTVTVRTQEPEWTAVPVANEGGESFLTVTARPESRSLDISCTANSTTEKRSQYVKVTAGNQMKTLWIEQSGKPTTLSVSRAVVTFMPTGGSKSVEVYSNSAETEADNNNRNWRVYYKPSWVNVVGEEKKEDGFLRKLGGRLKKLVEKESSAVADSTVITSVMKIVVSAKPYGAQPRSGEILIKSGDQQAKIIVQQD